MKRRTFIRSFVAAAAAGKVWAMSESSDERRATSGASGNSAAGGGGPEWDNPNLAEYRAIRELAAAGGSTEEIATRLKNLEEYVEYAFGLDPRE